MLRSFILIQCVSLLVFAAKVPIRTTSHKNNHRRLIQRDATDKNETLENSQDRIYVVDVTVAGTTYEAQLDTGSADLWVAPTANDLKTLNTTSIPVKLNYGVGFASGTVAVDTVEFAGVKIEHQALLAATQVNNPITSLNANALVGVGFNKLSTIDFQINSTGGSYGRSLLFNLFTQNSSTANYMAVALQRENDPEDDVVGSISLSEIDPDFASVLQTSRIPMVPPQDPLRWTIAVDSISVNGTVITNGSSVVPAAPSGKMVGLLDTGTTFVSAPQKLVDTIYGSVPGATFSAPLGTWIVPCDAEIDISINIGNRVFFLHPLDASIPTAGDNSTCQGTWLSIPGGDDSYDFIFGVTMLRSVLAVYNYGDFKDDMSLGNPYVQLWSLVTNATEASNEFHTVRGGALVKNSFPNNAGVNDPSSSSSPPSGGTSQGGSTPDLQSLQTKVDRIYSFAPALFALTALNVILLLVIAAGFVLRMTRRRKRRSSKSKNKSPKSGNLEESDPFDPEEASGGSFIPLARPNASASQAQYRPVSSGSTLRDSRFYDAPKSPGQEKSFHYDAVKGMDDDESLPLPRPRAPALRSSFRPLSSGSTLRDSRLYDAPKSPGFDKSFGFDQTHSPVSPVPMTFEELPLPPNALLSHEPLVSIQETPSVGEIPVAQHPPVQSDHAMVHTQDITALNNMAKQDQPN